MSQETPSEVQAEIIDVQPVGQTGKSAGKLKKQKKHAKRGPKPVVDQNVVNNLLAAFAAGATVMSACLIAGISKQTFYNFTEEYPEFLDLKERIPALPGIEAAIRLRREIKERDSNSVMEVIRYANDKFGHPDLIVDTAARLPGAGAVRLSGPSVQINVGGQQQNAQGVVQQNQTPLPTQVGADGQRMIRAEDLTDDELYRVSRGEATLEDVLAGRELVHAAKH